MPQVRVRLNDTAKDATIRQSVYEYRDDTVRRSVYPEVENASYTSRDKQAAR